MREDFPRISVRDPKRYKALWRAENRVKLQRYYRDYRKKKRVEMKAGKNGGAKRPARQKLRRKG